MATVLITGCSKGIGFESALAFARAGYNVLATMRNPTAAPALAEIAAKEKLPISISQMDVDSDTSVSDGFAQLTQEHGDIDILFNNAGLEHVGSVEDTPLTAFRAVMETNYFGSVRCIKAVVGSMRERRHGCIINMSSIAGRLSCPPFAAYAPAKWALEALTEALAGEMKTFNVRVMVIEPGIIDTAMAQRVGKANGGDSPYCQSTRFGMMFSKALQTPIPPSFVAARVLELAESDNWTVRHLIGPDTEPFLGWRQSMHDEAWRDLHAGDNETFFASIGG